MHFTVHPVPVPESDAALGPVARAYLAAERAVYVADYGHADHCWTPAGLASALTGTPYERTRAWVAFPASVAPDTYRPEDALGFANAALPLTDDLDNVVLHVGVRPDARRQGIGTALLEAVEGLASEVGRGTLLTWSPSAPVSGGDPRLLAARSGTSGVDGTTPGARWLVRHGFALEQADRMSTLVLDEQSLALALQRQGEVLAQVDDDYELVSWVGPAPEEFRAPLAALRVTFSVDAPAAGLAFGEQAWDAERIAVLDAEDVARGMGSCVVAASHRGSGELVGFTHLHWDGAAPEGVWQYDTFVRGDHRGRRLGLLVKAANALLLREANPDALRVHTWNAEENAHMLAVNEALGFQTACVEGAWQRRSAPVLPAVGPEPRGRKG